MPRGSLPAYERALAARYPSLPENLCRVLVRRHGTRTPRILGEAKTVEDLGRYFGDTLYAAEVDYLVHQEWARSAEDVLWRRTKCGLHLDARQAGATTSRGCGRSTRSLARMGRST